MTSGPNIGAGNTLWVEPARTGNDAYVLIFGARQHTLPHLTNAAIKTQRSKLIQIRSGRRRSKGRHH